MEILKGGTLSMPLKNSRFIRILWERDNALYLQFRRVNHIFKHIHLIQSMSRGPTDCLQSSFDDVHNLFPTKIALENAHCSTQLAALPGPPNGHYQIRNLQVWQIFSGITSWALERTWHFKQWFGSAAVEQLKSGSRRAQIVVAWWSGGGDWAREIAVVTIQIGVKRCIVDRSSVELSTYCAVVGWSDWNCSFVQKASDWKKAEKVRESGMIHLGRIDACNSGGLLVRFGSLQGFLPFSQMDSARIPKGACWSLLKEVVVLTILENPEHLEVQV